MYQQMQRFAEVTKTLIMWGKIERAKQCLQAAEYIFSHGNDEIKILITNVYVFSVSSFF